MGECHNALPWMPPEQWHRLFGVLTLPQYQMGFPRFILPYHPLQRAPEGTELNLWVYRALDANANEVPDCRYEVQRIKTSP
jgi:hypothetical protein